MLIGTERLEGLVELKAATQPEVCAPLACPCVLAAAEVNQRLCWPLVHLRQLQVLLRGMLL